MYDPAMYGFPQGGSQGAPPPGVSAPGALPIAASPRTAPVGAAAGIDPAMLRQLMQYASAMRNPQTPKIGMPSDTSPPGPALA